MRSPHTLLPLALCGALLLAGCTTTVSDPPAASPSSDTAGQVSAVQDTTAPVDTAADEDAEPEPAVTISAESITDASDIATTPVPLSDGSAVLDLLTKVTGTTPEGAPVTDPAGDEDAALTLYDWGDVSVTVSATGEVVDLIVLSPTIGDVPIRTASGIAVGSLRSDVVAADGQEEADGTGDDLTDEFIVDASEVPGTDSLVDPGSAGSEYVRVVLEDETVTQLQIPANDFSDL